jgi:hypothetical protein
VLISIHGPVNVQAPSNTYCMQTVNLPELNWMYCLSSPVFELSNLYGPMCFDMCKDFLGVKTLLPVRLYSFLCFRSDCIVFYSSN